MKKVVLFTLLLSLLLALCGCEIGLMEKETVPQIPTDAEGNPLQPSDAKISPEDAQESIRTMLALKKAVKTPVSYHANGKAGALSRIINPLLGAQIAFCVEHYDEGSTMEQMDLRTAAAVIENVRKLL